MNLKEAIEHLKQIRKDNLMFAIPAQDDINAIETFEYDNRVYEYLINYYEKNNGDIQ